MADDADLAYERDEKLNESLLKVRKPVPDPPTGFCLFCDEKIPETHRYCDGECRKDHEKELYMRSQSPK